MESMNNDEVQLKENEVKENSNNSTKFSLNLEKLFLPKRVQVAALTWSAFVIVFGGKFNHFLSIAVHHIHPALNGNFNSSEDNTTTDNRTEDYSAEDYNAEDYNSDLYIGLQAIFSFYCGYLLTGIPGGFLSYRFPATRVYFWSVVVSCFTNSFYPLCVHNKGAVLFLHIIQGLAEGMLLPSFFGIWKNWSPIKELNLLLPISFSGLFFGILVGSGLSYEMLKHWDIPYYIFGGFALIWLILWLWLVYENPLQHPTIKQDELVLFSNLHAISVGSIPWVKFFTSFPVWAIMIGNLCHNYICSFGVVEIDNHFIFTEYLMFSEDEYKELRWWAALDLFLPYSSAVILIPFLSYLAYFLTNRKAIPVIKVRKGFVGFGFAFMSIFWILDIFFYYALPFCTIAISFSLVGIFANPLEISPKYASILVGISNTFTILLGILIPNIFIMTIVTDYILVITLCVIGALLSLTGCVFYCVYGSDSREDWAE